MAKNYKTIIPYADIVKREGIILQKGMNFRANPHYSILLMSVRKGAPYNDRWHDDTDILEYEGHDEPKRGAIEPKLVDQPMRYPTGNLTENGKFYEAAIGYKRGTRSAEIVQIYEKISQGIWCDNAKHEMIDAKIISDGRRKVFRFFLKPTATTLAIAPFLKETRIIPTPVKVEVWKRDQGKCVICGSTTNLHFDHDIPFSKGGSSITAQNVRLLCVKHNLSKSDKIMGFGPWAVGIASIVMSHSA